MEAPKNKSKNASFQSNSDGFNWWITFSIVVAATFLTRFYKVTEPDHVCWDETHFGKMGSWYINRTFFFDVHPPLGKMMIGLSGYLTGYNGTFPFEKPGDKYEGVNYIGMRVFCTFLGACIVPFAFVTTYELTKSLRAASFASLLLLCDIGFITLNQYILLDPILLFFVSGSVMGMVKVRSLQVEAFGSKWWMWLTITGFMLAGAVSVKFVGLFVVLLAGLYTISELWEILGDMTQPVSWTLKHFAARALCLIVWPCILYITYFYIHLAVLNHSGNGDGFYSSAFQSQLVGNSLHNASMPRQVAFGAVVTLKNGRTGGGYLHSHWHLYPEGVGARQQQITTYTHKDQNNRWLIKPYDKEQTKDDEVVLLREGDLVRLQHVATERNLHSHREPAPLSKKHLQVTGYGEHGVGDANDVWKVIIDGGSEGDVVETVTSKLRFVHYLQGCVLTSSSKQLPKWAYEQQEVSCNPNIRDSHAVWNVEDNIYEKLPNVSFSVYAPGFFERFIESHAVMLQGNAGLKPKEGEVTSRPWQWPINYRGQFFSGSGYRIYLLGNPVIWWSNLLFLPLALLVLINDAIRTQRGYEEPTGVTSERRRTCEACSWLLLAWLIHYVPFWSMGRVLYFHHYFPALYFTSLLTGVNVAYCLDSVHLFVNEPQSFFVRHAAAGVIIAACCYSFILFSPLAYGMTGNESNSTMRHLRWLDSWEF